MVGCAVDGFLQPLDLHFHGLDRAVSESAGYHVPGAGLNRRTGTDCEHFRLALNAAFGHGDLHGAADFGLLLVQPRKRPNQLNVGPTSVPLGCPQPQFPPRRLLRLDKSSVFIPEFGILAQHALAKLDLLNGFRARLFRGGCGMLSRGRTCQTGLRGSTGTHRPVYPAARRQTIAMPSALKRRRGDGRPETQRDGDLCFIVATKPCELEILDGRSSRYSIVSKRFSRSQAGRTRGRGSDWRFLAMDHDRHRASPIREQGRQFVDFVVSHPQVLVFRIVEQRLEGRIAAVRLAAFLLIKQNEPGQSYANGYRREERASTSRTLLANSKGSGVLATKPQFTYSKDSRPL